ncbi:MAG: hypothetical protein KF847_05025 [Pirellulales bacterium]|nr:hypothetical protein [Pirellulales bacterium]
MPINVTCPKCLTKFTVGDQHAGKTGACPKCKGPITVPTLEEQVVIHAPEFGEAGAKDAKGRSVLKPISRKETKFQLNAFLIIAGAALLAVGIAFLAGRSLDEAQQTWALAIGAVLLGPPLAYGGYSFLRDDELDAYAGGELIIRCAACGLVFALCWGVYWFLGRQLFGNDTFDDGLLEIYQIGILIGVAAGIGTLASFASFDLEPISGFFHFVLYFVVCIVLRAIMGLALLPGMGGG